MTRSLAFLALAGLGAACAAPHADVRRDWTGAIGDLGLAAIYPMQSGVKVGALWVTDGPAGPGDRRYRSFSQLPAGTGAIRSVALPSVTVDADDAATLGLGGLLASIGLSDTRDDAVSLDLTGVQASTIEDAQAWGLLAGACAPGGSLARLEGAFHGSARSLGAFDPRGAGYLTVLTTVYTATGIDYDVTDSSDLALGEAAGGAGTPTAPASAGTIQAATGAEGRAAGGATTRGDGTESAANRTTEALSQSFDQPLAFAYDGFTIAVPVPGGLCEAVLSGQAAAQ